MTCPQLGRACSIFFHVAAYKSGVGPVAVQSIIPTFRASDKSIRQGQFCASMFCMSFVSLQFPVLSII